jgi:hypothetical protein
MPSSADDIVIARDKVVEAIGNEAMIDAAAVIANFQRMVRIADGTGIPLDEPVLMFTQDIRAELGINEFNAAQNSPDLPVAKRIIGKLLGPFAPKLLTRLAGRGQ